MPESRSQRPAPRRAAAPNPDSRAQRLHAFADWTRQHITGDEKGEAQIFLDPLLSVLELSESTPSDAASTAVLSKVDSAHVQGVWNRALERRGNDPEGAITLARTLLESVCKHILDERGVQYADGADLPKLYSLVATELNLSPAQHTE